MAIETKDLVVIGGGPGGYAAAFRAADLGRKVTLIDARRTLGGVCLNEGCIPSKALLHAAGLITQARDHSDWGIVSDEVRVDLDRLREKTRAIVQQLTGGLAQVAKRRKVEIVMGAAKFADERTIIVDDRRLEFRNAIIAVGSSSIALAGWPESERIWNSTDALELRFIPKKLAIVGGGIIGLEMAVIYSALGSEITVVDVSDRIMPGADPEAVRMLRTSLESRGIAFRTATKVEMVSVRSDVVILQCSGDGAGELVADAVIQAVGRRANGEAFGADKAGIDVDGRGCVMVGDDMRTSRDDIFAIGDVTGGPMLAHRASHQGKVAAEAACGLPSRMVTTLIPSVAYTVPEVAWVGRIDGDDGTTGASKFPWSASGRNTASEASVGMTKLTYCRETRRILGGTIVGAHAGELIAEISLAIEMGATLEDLSLTVHPHPTLSETTAFAAERALGTLTEL